MMTTKSAFLTGVAMLLALMSPAQAQIANNTIKLGVLTDLTGIATDSTGAGSVAAAKLAIEDFNKEKPDVKVELLQADHQNKPDIGGAIARRWFEVMRGCGDDVRELLHDGAPTACVGDAAFGYVNAFRAHVNVGFFRGAEIADPAGLLEGTGRFMRHVKLGPGRDVDPAALTQLIHTAYTDIKR